MRRSIHRLRTIMVHSILGLLCGMARRGLRDAAVERRVLREEAITFLRHGWGDNVKEVIRRELGMCRDRRVKLVVAEGRIGWSIVRTELRRAEGNRSRVICWPCWWWIHFFEVVEIRGLRGDDGQRAARRNRRSRLMGSAKLSCGQWILSMRREYRLTMTEEDRMVMI